MSSSKKLTCKGNLRQVFICLRPPSLLWPHTPPHTLYTCTQYSKLYTYSQREGRWDEPERRLEGQQFMGRKYQHDWMFLQSINSDKHLPQSPFKYQFFRWRHFALVLYGTAESRIFHRTPAGHTAEKKTRRKRNRGCYGLLSVPRQPFSPLPLPPTSRACRIACGYVIRISWRETPPPSHSPPPSTGWIYVIFSNLGQKRGRPLFRGSKVLQLNSASFCDYVRIWTEVIGHLWAELGFWFFPEKRWKYSRREHLTGREFLAGRASTTSRYSTAETPPI